MHDIAEDNYPPLARLRCLDCDARLIAGPRGGLARNYYCSERQFCRQGFNLTFFGDRLIFAQRIGVVDDERFALYAGD